MSNQTAQQPRPSGILASLSHFVRTALWRIETRRLTPLGRFLIQQARVSVIVGRGFARDRIRLRAAALTYISLLSLVPLLAVVFSIFKGLGGFKSFEDRLKPFLYQNLAAGAQETVRDYIEKFVENVNAGAIGGIGIVFLVFTVVSLLENIEMAFNDIWGLKKDRSLFQRFVTYWSMITVGPILLGASLTLTASLQSNAFVAKLIESSPHSHRLLSLAPILLTWTGFTLLYIIMPNTKVRFSPALIGAVIAGSIWELAKYGYTYFTAKAFQYHAIYGSLGTVPIFLLWLYLTWLIVLFGARVAFANQNVNTYTDEERSMAASHALREFIALRVMAEIAACYRSGRPPPQAEAIAGGLNLPVRLVNDVIYVLVSGSLVTEALARSKLGAFKEKNPGFVPSRPLDQILVFQVLACVRQNGESGFAASNDPMTGRVREILEEAEKTSLAAAAGMTIEQMISTAEKAEKLK